MRAIDLTEVFQSVGLDKTAIKLHEECIGRGLKEESPTQINVIYCDETKQFTVLESMRNGIQIKVKDLLCLSERIKDEDILIHVKDEESGKHFYNWKKLPCFII